MMRSVIPKKEGSTTKEVKKDSLGKIMVAVDMIHLTFSLVEGKYINLLKFDTFYIDINLFFFSGGRRQ